MTQYDINAQLFKAVAEGNLAEVERLLVADTIDISARDDDGRTPLHVAAEKGQTEIANALIYKGGFDTNAKDNEEDTPLHATAHHGHAETACALLQAGAVVNLRDKKDRTPLDVAEYKKNKLVVEVLKRWLSSQDDDKIKPPKQARLPWRN